MDKKMKQIFIIALTCVALFALLMNFETVLPFLSNVVSLIMPVIAGAILAMFINVPVNGVEKLLRKTSFKNKDHISDNTYHTLGFAVTLFLTAVVIFLIITIIAPAVKESVESLYYLAQRRLPELIDYLNTHNMEYSWLEDFMNSSGFNNMMKNAGDTAQMLLGGVASAISTTVSAIITTIFSVVIAIYITLSKYRVVRHARTFALTYIKPKWSEKLIAFCRVFSKTFAKFLSGQCAEAIILGLLMFVTFMIFRLPYAALVGVLTAFCAIIPYIGAFISCTLSTLVIAMVSPLTALKALAVYLCVQFVENQFIYPRVVGANIGLAPLYTLIAALIGGKLFGIIGILLFIPLVATIFILVKEDTKKKSGNTVFKESLSDEKIS